jgi:hypothetical protein
MNILHEILSSEYLRTLAAIWAGCGLLCIGLLCIGLLWMMTRPVRR